MERLRAAISYSNVMATVAVFIALGGGAYAVTRDQVDSGDIARDAVKAKHIDFGVRSQVMMANFSNLGQGTNSENMPPVGAARVGGGTVNEMTVPQTFIGTGLRIRLDGPIATGSREFGLSYYDYRLDEEVDSDLRCTVAVGENTCRSHARVRVPAGASVWFDARHTGTTQTDYAEVGWRAVLP